MSACTESEAVDFFRRRAQSYAKKGQFAKTTALLRRAVEYGPVLSLEEQATLRLELADALYAQHLTQEAISEYKLALDIGIGISRSGACASIAKGYTRERDYKTALDYYSTALKQPDVQLAGDIYFGMAQTYLSAGRYDEAIRYTNLARESDLSHPAWELDRSLGIAYLGRRDIQTALDHLISAADSGLVDIPGNVYRHIGEAYLMQGEYDKAEEFFGLTAEDSQLDTSAGGHLKLGLLYEQRRDYFNAMVEYGRAEKKYAEAEARGIISSQYVREKLQEVRERLAALRRGRILRCYKTGGECPHGSTEPLDKTVFVAMPFGHDTKQEADFDGILRYGISPAVIDAGLIPIRGDTLPNSIDIMCRVCLLIQRARFVVADLTTGNRNVFYEVGLAHALEKDVILVAKSLNSVPFDLQSLGCIQYEDSGALRSKLTEHLSALLCSGNQAITRL